MFVYFNVVLCRWRTPLPRSQGGVAEAEVRHSLAFPSFPSLSTLSPTSSSKQTGAVVSLFQGVCRRCVKRQVRTRQKSVGWFMLSVFCWLYIKCFHFIVCIPRRNPGISLLTATHRSPELPSRLARGAGTGVEHRVSHHIARARTKVGSWHLRCLLRCTKSK